MSLLTALLPDNLLETVMLQDAHIARRKDAATGSGGFDDPYNSLVRKADGTDDPLPSADRLDAIMAGIPANRTIRFGPGLFYTRGQTGWQAKDGMRLLGAGMNVTTLRLVGIPY